MPSASPGRQEAGAPCSGKNCKFRHVMVCGSCRFSPVGWGEKRFSSWFSQQLHALLACRAQGISAGWKGTAMTYIYVETNNSDHILLYSMPKLSQSLPVR